MVEASLWRCAKDTYEHQLYEGATARGWESDSDSIMRARRTRWQGYAPTLSRQMRDGACRLASLTGTDASTASPEPLPPRYLPRGRPRAASGYGLRAQKTP